MKQTTLFPLVEYSAKISDCGNYRYSLSRIWDKDKEKVMFLMLNPSTADANENDPTIRRCMGFAKSWGYGGLLVGNLFQYRSTNPDHLLKCENPIGHDNEEVLFELSQQCHKVILAYGNDHIIQKLGQRFPSYDAFREIKKPLYYLEFSKDGVPVHPLYLHSSLKPIELQADFLIRNTQHVKQCLSKLLKGK